MSPTATRSLPDTEANCDDAAGTVAGAETAGGPGSDARAGPAAPVRAAGAAVAAEAGAAVAPVEAVPGQAPGSACGDSNCGCWTMGALAATRVLSTRGGCLVAMAGTSSSEVDTMVEPLLPSRIVSTSQPVMKATATLKPRTNSCEAREGCSYLRLVLAIADPQNPHLTHRNSLAHQPFRSFSATRGAK